MSKNKNLHKAKSNFSKISDRLIEDTNRRNKGEFYTPTTFVDKAHRMIEKALGEDWKEKFVVWDNCCGTKNLTRDYRFNELYCSTLEQGELDQCTGYNKEAVSFQFDFLNDSLDKLPASLIEALKANKPIVFLLNPPYATANNAKKGTSKAGVAKTMINEAMLADKIGACSQNLYAQFLYRILIIKREFNLTNCHIALFSPTLFLSGGSFKGFRTAYLNEFKFDNAVQFKASHFADCAEDWGISFSLWHNGETTDKNNFNYINIDNVEGEIVSCGEKIVYNADGLKTASDWVKESVKKLETEDTPHLTNAINVTEKGYGNIVKNALGYMQLKGNNVNENTMGVSMLSGMYANAHGVSVTKDNFDRCTALFAARKLIEKNWVNSKDEYLAPNEAHPGYNEFVNDSLIYSLFHSSSNQSSLRNVEYKDKLWDINNEFFWRSAAEMAEKANACGNDEMYLQAINKDTKDRYVYNKLQGIELSAEAKAVLDKANEILDATMSRRKVYNEEHPEYQVNNWDCGWYQIKAMATKEELKEFKVLFDKLADKMRPMVYELGFLK